MATKVAVMRFVFEIIGDDYERLSDEQKKVLNDKIRRIGNRLNRLGDEYGLGASFKLPPLVRIEKTLFDFPIREKGK